MISNPIQSRPVIATRSCLHPSKMALFSTGATRYNAAAQLYLGVEMVREAVEAFIAGEEWSKAKKVARELEPRLEAFVDEQYKQSLRTKGNAKDLEDVDLISALDMYVEQGNWSKAIATASGHGPEVLHKYVAMHATQLIREGNPQAALQLYTKHGAPPYQANFNIYKRIGVDLFSSKQLDNAEAYNTWAELRDLYLGLLESLAERYLDMSCILELLNNMFSSSQVSQQPAGVLHPATDCSPLCCKNGNSSSPAAGRDFHQDTCLTPKAH